MTKEQAENPTPKGKQWYIVHVYSGFEGKAREALLERVKQAKMEEKFEDVLIPAETVVEVKKGEKRSRSKKFFPGYIFVKMELTNETWHLVKNTQRITGFVGNSIHPPAVPEAEVMRITQQIKEGKMKPKVNIEFEKGESVRVKEGPFANFAGTVDDVNPEKGRLKVLVSIFGRSTPIDLEFAQVEKA